MKTRVNIVRARRLYFTLLVDFLAEFAAEWEHFLEERGVPEDVSTVGYERLLDWYDFENDVSDYLKKLLWKSKPAFSIFARYTCAGCGKTFTKKFKKRYHNATKYCTDKCHKNHSGKIMNDVLFSKRNNY